MRANFRWTWLEAALCVVLLGVGIGEVLIYSPPLIHAEQNLGVSVQSVTPGDTTVRLQLAVTHGSGDSAIQLAAFPVATGHALAQPDVYVYADTNYPTAGVAPTVALGVYDHLQGELTARGYSSHVSAVTALALAKVFKDTANARNSRVVMMTGVAPDLVFSKTLDLITPWVEAGGVVAWAGGAIGYWNGTRGQPLSATNVMGEHGTEQLLGAGIIDYPTQFGREGTARSDWASALDLSYRFTGAGVRRDTVASRGGISLGWYSGLYQSISFVPHGSGGYLIFGGEVPDEAAVAVDLTKIVMSDALSGSGVVASRRVGLTSTSTPARISWDVPFNPAGEQLALVAFDPSQDGVFFSAQAVKLP